MNNEKELVKEIISLIYSGDYEIAQQINGGEEESYDGCEHNLIMVLESGEAKVALLNTDDPRAREGCRTYTIEYSTLFCNATIVIWEN